MIATRRLRATCIVVVALALLIAPARGERLDLEAVARDISTDVGKVGKISTAGSKGLVFVFEEYHTSRVGQLQIAIMLLRLRSKHGLQTVALEGAVQAPQPISAQWFHTAGGEAARDAREDVAIRMLGEGEISSAEFLALLSPEVDVYGAELQAQYDVKLDTEGAPEIAYLFEIAKKNLSQSDIKKANELISNKKQDEAIKFILESDPWVRKRYEALKGESLPSIEEMLARAREIQRKAREVGAEREIEAGAKQDMEKAIAFFEAAAKRSKTMTELVRWF